MIRQILTLPFFIAASHAELAIHPVPQRAERLEGELKLGATTRITGLENADSSAMAKLQQRLGEAKGPGNVSEIVIGRRGDTHVDAYLKELPEKSGAYRVLARDGKLIVAGHDARGTYYAVRTLEQILAADGVLPAVDVLDWPEVPFRGVVEGFYGTPWSHEKRLSLIRFMGEHKLDTYIYGPKDDSYHSSPHWRLPYPEPEAARIKELTDACRAAHVDFVWAIHPGKDIQWNDEDFGNVLNKFDAMYQLGVRSFSVFFDDISGEGTKADQQARLLNFLHAEFVAKKGDITPLVMCPTQYNRSWSNGDYLDVLGEKLHPSIHVMWTGNTVVADLDRPSMEWINGRIKRRAYIWWNFPVSDYVRNHLLMGPVYGNRPDIGPLYGGFVSNPMERSESSKIALYGVAGYTWNPSAFDSEADWKTAIRLVLPEAPDAFERFCAHNSDLGPNGHGYRRKESEAFAPVAERFLTELRDGEKTDVSAVRAELEKIAAAPAAIREGSNNPLLMQEIGSWLDAFEKLGEAGVFTIDALVSLESNQLSEAWSQLSSAHASMDALAEIDRTQNRNPYQPGIRTGSLVVTPLVSETLETVDSRLLAKISGRPVFRFSGITSTGVHDSLPRMLDGKDDTYFYAKEIQKKDDWFGVDLGGMHQVRRVRIMQGRNDGDHDLVHLGVLEGDDGNGWREFAKVSGVSIDVTLEEPALYRRIRLRVEQPGVPGGKPDVWTAIRRFEVNPRDAASLRTDIGVFAMQPVRYADGTFSISPAFEVHPFPPGKFIGLLFPEEIRITKVELDLKIENPSADFSLEGSADGHGWRRIEAKENGTKLVADETATLRAIRVRNHGRATRQVTLSAFTVASPVKENPLAALSDRALGTSARIGTEGASVALVSRADEVIILLAEKQNKGLRVFAETSVGLKPLVLSDNPLQRLALPAGATSIHLAASDAASPVVVHEIIFITR